MSKHIKIGEIGEDIACVYLLENGYKLIERNYREKYGEIDIIAMDKGKILVFVEVKTLKTDKISDVDNSAIMGITPEDNATFRKLEKIKRIAQFYANCHSELLYKDKGWRIDLLAILVDEEGGKEIKHYENVV